MYYVKIWSLKGICRKNLKPILKYGSGRKLDFNRIHIFGSVVQPSFVKYQETFYQMYLDYGITLKNDNAL